MYMYACNCVHVFECGIYGTACTCSWVLAYLVLFGKIVSSLKTLNVQKKVRSREMCMLCMCMWRA